ncbi:ATP-dependent DNA helicase II subunit 2 [Terramyces sp. JEL0728]|nr:ATP-dependent DNA helicase II subunit 2 [Terramyces sp. JEL0728]
MGVLTVGQYLDGSPLDYLDYSNAVDIIALVVTLCYLTANIILMIQIARGWLEIPPSKIYTLVWYMNILLFIYYIAMLLRQMEILQAFTTNSVFLNVKRIQLAQKLYVVFNLVSMGGLYISVGYLGYPRPDIIAIVIIANPVAFLRFHAIYVSRSVIYHLTERKRMNLSNSAKNQDEDTAFKLIYYVVNVDIIVNWIGVVIWVISFFYQPFATPFGHGARFPTSKAFQAHLDIVELVQKSSLFQNEKLDLNYGNSSNAGLLHPTGKESVFEYGQRFQARYKIGVLANQSKFFMSSSNDKRVLQTASNFFIGMTGTDLPNGVVKNRTLDADNDMNKSCFLFVNTPKNKQESNLFEKPIKKELTLRVNNELQMDLNDTQVGTLQDACAFQLAFGSTLNQSICKPFNQQDFVDFSLDDNLSKFYTLSYGLPPPLNSQLGCSPLTGLVTNIKDQELKATFHFGHAETIIPMITSLGLFKDSKPLQANDSLAEKQFQAAKIAPFQSNLVFEVYAGSTTANPDIRLLLNEQPIDLPCSTNGLVSLQAFELHYKDIIGCKFDSICQNPYTSIGGSNDEGYENVFEVNFNLQDPVILSPANIKMIKLIEQQKPTKDGDIMDALIVAVQMIAKHTVSEKTGKPLKYDKKIYIFTNGEAHVDQDGSELVTGKLDEQQIKLSLCGFDFHDTDTQKFLQSLTNRNDESLGTLALIVGVYFESQDALDLINQQTTRQVKPTTTFRGSLVLGDPENITTSLRIPIWVYNKTSVLAVPTAKKQSKPGLELGDGRIETIISLKSIKGEKDEEMERVKSFRYGKHLVPFTEQDEQNAQLETFKSLSVITFVPKTKIKREHYMGNVLAVIKDPTSANVQLDSIVEACKLNNTVGIARYVRTDRSGVKVCALIPNKKGYFYMIQLPYQNDIYHFNFSTLPPPKQDSTIQELIDNFIDSNGQELMPKEVYNPVYQRMIDSIINRAMGKPIPTLSPFFLQLLDDELLKPHFEITKILEKPKGRIKSKTAVVQVELDDLDALWSDDEVTEQVAELSVAKDIRSDWQSIKSSDLNQPKHTSLDIKKEPVVKAENEDDDFVLLQAQKVLGNQKEDFVMVDKVFNIR